ncbi:MAG: xanthine dehydrogenase small subunit [Pseudomonadota bacterium]
MGDTVNRTLRFLHDGNIVEIDGAAPTRTVLQWLREDRMRCGTKEGCAEGDCGACMVVVASLNEDATALDYHAINSCIQFLPTLHGKELITVENLSPAAGPLHPVQQALVDCHGSQCGFCTPGFVMTLFAMYKSGAPEARSDIDDALAGNLCRCTGYRPIIDAARRMVALQRPAGRHAQPHGAESSDAERSAIETLCALNDDAALHTESSKGTFAAPTDVDAFARLYAAEPNRRILAGGTDIGLWVTKDYRDIDDVLYIGNVEALRDITVTDSVIDVGAAVTFTELMPVLLDDYPELSDLFRRWASPPIRNAATLGGNIANGSPIGDSMPALIALGTRVLLRHDHDTREIDLESLYIDYQVNDLQPGEFVKRIRIPRRRPGQLVASYKLSKRFDQDISAVCAAFSAQVADGQTQHIRIAYGGVAGVSKRALATETALADKPFDEATVRAAMAVLDKDFAPLSDMRASADYRATATRNLLYRFFAEATGLGATDVYTYAR